MARLVEVEIVSPYCGILINTGVGNPTVPLGGFLRNRQVFRLRRRRSIFVAFIKEPRAVLFYADPFLSPYNFEFQHPRFDSIASICPIMSGPSPQGRWMASSVIEEDMAKLRAARYLTAEIPHRLPAQGQVIPTPGSGERVVFISHFLRG